MRAVATMTLSRYGFTVLDASDGYEALEVFRKRKEEIDAVLLDMTMPRLSGEEVLQELRKIRPDVCVVLSSGYDERQATDRLAGGEPYGFLQKPYAPTALAEKMSAAVRGQRCPLTGGGDYLCAGPGQSNPGCDPAHFDAADLDHDVDVVDIVTSQRNFGQSCP